MCTSAFVDQTRQSLNPIQNLNNLQHPAVALHQAESGIGLRQPAIAAQPATQAAYAPDTNAVAGMRANAVRAAGTGVFGSLLAAGPSVATGGGSLLGS